MVKPCCTTVVIEGDEYLEIKPSVKPMIEISSGTFKPLFLATIIALAA